MNCPVDGETLTMADRQGVEIDYCPKCRGVWLDRGELDKIIERSAREIAAPQPARRQEGDAGYREYPTHYETAHHKRKRHGSFLGELFDFD
ncbi:MAG: zf-TFIIB domain-containing protein [Candidatus Sericytochromatia bacterium]|nr:zf-TFIIB domain-containing protein [Candidatus Tanganyikabacteria bacterium]